MSSNIDQDFVEYIVKSLVGKPDQVIIERRIDEKGVLLELTVDPEDLGRIIGKRGATAQSLRTLLRALGTKNDARYNLKIVDNGPEDYERPPRPERDAKANDNQSEDNAHAEPPKPAEKPKEQPAPQDQPREKKPQREQRDRRSYKERAEDKLLGSIEEADEPAAEIPEPVQEDTSSERAKRTRQELQDLDDLDIQRQTTYSLTKTKIYECK